MVVLYMHAPVHCLQSLDTVYHGALRFVTGRKAAAKQSFAIKHTADTNTLSISTPRSIQQYMAESSIWFVLNSTSPFKPRVLFLSCLFSGGADEVTMRVNSGRFHCTYSSFIVRPPLLWIFATADCGQWVRGFFVVVVCFFCRALVRDSKHWAQTHTFMKVCSQTGKQAYSSPSIDFLWPVTF